MHPGLDNYVDDLRREREPLVGKYHARSPRLFQEESEECDDSGLIAGTALQRLMLELGRLYVSEKLPLQRVTLFFGERMRRDREGRLVRVQELVARVTAFIEEDRSRHLSSLEL